MGKVCEWSKVARWERWENSEVARSERWERIEVAIWESGRVVSREGSMVTNLCCITPAKRNLSKDSLQGFDNSYPKFGIIEVTQISVA